MYAVAVGCSDIYSLNKHGNLYVSDHFKVREFKCNDGSDTIIISPLLVDLLEKIRMSCGSKPVYINSGYRTEAYNKKIKGATYSYHKYGMAADIIVEGLSPKLVYQKADELMPSTGGVILYNSFVHVDVRSTKYRKT